MCKSTKNNALAALDREIDIMSSVAKSDDIKTWALIVAMAGILNLLASAWETGGQNWQKIAIIALGLFMLGESITLLRSISKQRPLLSLFQRPSLPIGIPSEPKIYSFFVILFVIFLLLSSKTKFPMLIFALGLVALCYQLLSLIIGMALFRTSTPLSPIFSFSKLNNQKLGHQINFYNKIIYVFSSGRHHQSLRRAARFTIYIISAVYFLAAVFAFSAILPIQSGNPLTNFRFAFLTYAALVVLSIILRTPSLRTLPSLIVLRRYLLSDEITASDAIKGLTLAQAGVINAPTLVNNNKRIATMVSEILEALRNTSGGYEHYKALPPEDREKNPIFEHIRNLKLLIIQASADLEFQRFLHPEEDSILLEISSQIEESLIPLVEEYENFEWESTKNAQQDAPTDAQK